jgi:hypothetical protein
MSMMQKLAWFQLAVIALALVVVLALLPFLGSGALLGFMLLWLMWFGPFVFRKKPDEAAANERDGAIERRSWVLAYTLYWVVFLLVATILPPLIYGPQGAVPVWIVQVGVLSGFMIVYALASVAILVQSARRARDME